MSRAALVKRARMQAVPDELDRIEQERRAVEAARARRENARGE